MTIHREGKYYLISTLIATLLFLLLNSIYTNWFIYIGLAISVFLFLFSLQFFRYPKRRNLELEEGFVICPADGKVVTIEEIGEDRTQISIFMSPLNVHANWIPLSGKTQRSQYYKGSYLVAWHPKSSTENERHETDILTANGHLVTVKQIAGAVARRIVCYIKKDDEVKLGDELGFIKFGSRVDLVVPSDSNIFVEKNQKVKGKIDLICQLP